jgi:hypothetical protein
MRRIALLGFIVLLPGCQYTGNLAGNPLDGFGGFIGDTHTWRFDPTAPTETSQTERLVRGEDVQIKPLLPEGGDVWPGPPAPIPTMEDLQNPNNQQQLPPPNVPSGPIQPVFPENAPASPGTTKFP